LGPSVCAPEIGVPGAFRLLLHPGIVLLLARQFLLRKKSFHVGAGRKDKPNWAVLPAKKAMKEKPKHFC